VGFTPSGVSDRTSIARLFAMIHLSKSRDNRSRDDRH